MNAGSIMQDNLPDIIQKIKQGDKNAFRVLLEKYQAPAFSFAFKILRDEHDARDVVQESFIIIWQKMETYDPNRSFKNWLFKILYNKSIDIIRRRTRKQSAYDLERFVELDEQVARGLDVRLENKELAALIELLTEGLPEKQKMVFTLRDLQGLSVDETAEISGMTDESIKSNLYHARKHLRHQLETRMNFQMKTK